MSELKLVAELSANHLGDYGRAMEIVEAAAEAGATHFKVQCWKAGTMCVDSTYRVPSGPWAGQSLQRLYAEAYTPWEWLPSIFARCRRLGMEPFGSAFDAASVDYLDSLGVTMHKVASFELTDIPLIRHMASKGKPIILSTGMATHAEIQEATRAAMHGTPEERSEITLLRCVSAYPAEPSGALGASLYRVAARGWDWGLSDHTPGIGVSVAAVALGATMIEKHLTLSRADGGLDAGFSLEPHEFAQLVTECKRAHAAIQPAEPQQEHAELRRSLWWAQDIAEGETITAAHLVTARPALGRPPIDMWALVGTKATKAAQANTPVT